MNTVTEEQSHNSPLPSEKTCKCRYVFMLLKYVIVYTGTGAKTESLVSTELQTGCRCCMGTYVAGLLTILMNNLKESANHYRKTSAKSIAQLQEKLLKNDFV